MINELKLLEEFRAELKKFEIGQKARDLLAQSQLVLLWSPSSAGRNTIIRELAKTDNYHFIVSDTTRQPRMNDGVMEQDGVEYNFRSEEDVLQDIRDGYFVEWEIIHEQQVSGVSVRELEKANQSGKVPITEVDLLGLETFKSLKDDLIGISILPPNFESWIERMTKRGELDQEEIRRRLTTAEKILERAIELKYIYFVINDDLQTAVNDVRAIVEHDEYDDEHRQKGEKVAWELLSKLKHELNT